MAIDSAAELLFRITADPSDATANMQRLRTFMSKTLTDLKGEFSDWTTRVFGDLSTAGGMLSAASAGLVAGVAAIGAALVGLGNKAADYAVEIGNASRRTGIGAEDMSKLRYAAEVTGTSFESLVQGLTRFTSTLDKARDPASKQAEAFHRMGIGQGEIEAGSKDLLPLIYKVSDAFRDQMTAQERTAMARDLFSRGGYTLVTMLGMGSDALREFGAEAQRLGLVMSTQDVQAAREYRAEVHYLKAELEGMALSVGKNVVPAMQDYMVGATSIFGGLKAALKDLMATGNTSTMGVAFFQGFLTSGLAAVQRIKDATKAALANQDLGLPPPGGNEETAQNFFGLSTALEQVRAKLAATQGEEAKAAQEAAHMTVEVGRATAEFQKLRDEGKLTPETIARESAALAALPQQVNLALQQEIGQYTEKRNATIARAGEELQKKLAQQDEGTYEQRVRLWNEEIDALRLRLDQEKALTRETMDALIVLRRAGLEKIDRERALAEAQAGQQLQNQLIQQEEQTYEQRVRLWAEEIDGMRARMGREQTLTKENQDLLVELERAGIWRIAREHDLAFAGEVKSLQAAIGQMIAERMTSAEKVQWLYWQDLEKFSQVEEEKAKAAASSESEIAQITAIYELARQTALDRYSRSLQAIYNSQGWRAVFGAEFAQRIRGNEALLREWSETTNQAAMMVRVALESLGEMGGQAFGNFSKAMGQNIAAAIVYSKSVGEAMRTALASTLATIAAECYVQAIYSTALGFLRLAQWDWAAAGNAFAAAAMFASVGTAAAMVGRAVAPRQAGATASGGSTAAAGGGGAAAGSGSEASAGGGRITVIVNGHIFGIRGVDELAQVINDAVENRDVKLVASVVKNPGRIKV